MSGFLFALDKIKSVGALPEYRLCVQFAEGITKIYDVKPLFDKWTAFVALENDPALLPEHKTAVSDVCEPRGFVLKPVISR